MKKLSLISSLTLSLICLTFVSASLYESDKTKSVQEKDYSDCLVKTTSAWGERHCPMAPNSSNTYRVTLKNTCSEAIDIKVGVQEADKRWKVFFRYGMTPNDSISVYSCNSFKGRYVKFARKAGDNSITLPTDAEINNTK